MKFVLDTETTGLPTKSRDWFGQPGIVQLACIKVDQQLKTVDRLSLLVNPEQGNWAKEAIETHGITQDKVAHAPTFYEVGSLLGEFVLGCDTWGGYHCQFDKDIVWYQLQRYGLHQNFPWPPRDFDVMKRVGKIMEMQGKRGNKNPTLSEAYKFCFNRDLTGAHDAMFDTEATLEIWRWTTLYQGGDE